MMHHTVALRIFAFIAFFAQFSPPGVFAGEECVQASALLPASVPDIKAPADLWLPPSVVDTDDYKDSSNWKPVQVCGVPADEKVCSTDSPFPTLTKATIGRVPQFSTRTTLDILQQAVSAWNGGAGVWPQMSLAARCEAVEEFLQLIEGSQNDLATALMWEIGKSWPDAVSEVTRTIQFGRAVIAAIRSNDPDIASDEMLASGSHRAWMRRAAIGIVLALGPYNYVSVEKKNYCFGDTAPVYTPLIYKYIVLFVKFSQSMKLTRL